MGGVTRRFLRLAQRLAQVTSYVFLVGGPILAGYMWASAFFASSQCSASKPYLSWLFAPFSLIFLIISNSQLESSFWFIILIHILIFVLIGSLILSLIRILLLIVVLHFDSRFSPQIRLCALFFCVCVLRFFFPQVGPHFCPHCSSHFYPHFSSNFTPHLDPYDNLLICVICIVIFAYCP